MVRVPAHLSLCPRCGAGISDCATNGCGADFANMDKGVRVYSREGNEYGLTTGGHPRHCTLEGCGRSRYGVRWPDGELTYPCSKGLTVNDDRYLQIG